MASGANGVVRIIWGSGRTFPSAASRIIDLSGGYGNVNNVLVGNLLFALPSTNYSTTYTQANALTAAAADTTDGYTNWRLPTYAEMQTLVNYVGAAGLITRGWASGAGDWHWTSTLQGGSNYYVYAPGQTGGTPTGFSFGPGPYRIALVREVA